MAHQYLTVTLLPFFHTNPFLEYVGNVEQGMHWDCLVSVSAEAVHKPTYGAAS